MANLKKQRAELIKGILGHKGAPQSVVARGMAKVEKGAEQRFRERNRQHASLARGNAPLRNHLLKSLRKDPAWVASISKLRASQKSPRIHRILPPGIDTSITEGLTFSPFISGTRVPPFDYGWTLIVKKGSPTASGEATPSNGLMEADIATGDDAASASVNAAVGIYFASPMDGVFNFSFSASPSVAFDWQELCSLSSAHSDGSIGLLAVSYDWSGDDATILVDQSISLWSNNSWIDDASGSNSIGSVPLSASIQVDSDHFYALFVRCSMNDSGDGFGTFSGSSAFSDLGIKVPSISWWLSLL